MPPIYRIQDKNGIGPFKPGKSHRWSEGRDLDKFPTPQMEFPDLQLPRGFHVGCGCVSIEQLRKWFNTREYKKLLELGYRAVQLIPARILACSAVQCVFVRRQALKFGALPVDLY